MLFCPLARTELLYLLPKGGEVAEIGVAQGEFSQEILARTSPKRLHLIDPWEHQERADYQRDGNNVGDDEQEARFRKVETMFAAERSRGEVEVHRAYSQDAAARFADAQLDWLYIDGLHSYEGVTADLQGYKRKVKAGGLILGHDYTNHVRAQGMDFGVVEAVNDFVRDEGYAFLALTSETFPTYVIARDGESEAAQNLMLQLVYHLPMVVELRDFPAVGNFQHKLMQIGDRLRVVSSF
jgi:hypothetical protein